MIQQAAKVAELMTPLETVVYLRLDDGCDEKQSLERLRNLCRRQRLPMLKRGRLRLFRRSAIDSWLEKGAR